MSLDAPRAGVLRRAAQGPAGTLPAAGDAPAQPQAASPDHEPAERPSRWRFGKESADHAGGPRASTRGAGKVGGPIGWLLRLALLGVLLFVVWQVQSHPATPQTSSPTGQSAGTPAGAQATVPPGQTALLPPDQVAALFLSAYFSWSGAETDDTYVSQWAWMVAPQMQSTLVSAAPRTRLDGGADAEAQSPVPTLAANALQVQQQRAQALARWTIQIIPLSADQSAWQARTIQATIILAQTGSLWQVVAVTWASTRA
jgi:hypothetical protein